MTIASPQKPVITADTPIRLTRRGKIVFTSLYTLLVVAATLTIVWAVSL